MDIILTQLILGVGLLAINTDDLRKLLQKFVHGSFYARSKVMNHPNLKLFACVNLIIFDDFPKSISIPSTPLLYPSFLTIE